MCLSKIFDFRAPPKMRIFWWENRKFPVMEPDACPRITFPFRNGQPWYFQKMFFENIEATWLPNFSKIRNFQYRKSRSKIANARIIQTPFVEESPLRMLLLYGVTTLRVMSLLYEGRERAASGPRQGRKNIRKCSETICLSKIFDFWRPTKDRCCDQDFEISESWKSLLGFV